MSKGVQIAGGATLIALLLGWYAASNLQAGATFAYYQTLEEFLATGAEESDVRVHGYVALGTIEREVAAQRVRFSVQNDPPHRAGASGEMLPVLFASLETPDLFKDGAEIVVEGQLAGHGRDAVFHADKLFAKCPSKFEAASLAPPGA